MIALRRADESHCNACGDRADVVVELQPPGDKPGYNVCLLVCLCRACQRALASLLRSKPRPVHGS